VSAAPGRRWLPAALDGVTRVSVASHGLVPPSRRNHPGAVDGSCTRRVIDRVATGPVARFVYLPGRAVNPGLRYLLDMSVAEATLPEPVPLDPSHFDTMGATTAREVVERWLGSSGVRSVDSPRS
jgi:hypothetical protein